MGCTAIAYHIGHRRSIDFDLFTRKKFDNRKIKTFLHRQKKYPAPIWDQPDQYTIRMNGVKTTFFAYSHERSRPISDAG
ncbi:hypothetical protein HYV44_02020 [Candidatus Microgenomates bacterium]|nr:hypothetical protein [Candidatus Microgenomates bacterium]